MSSVVAIDFGNENYVVATPGGGGVDIVLNPQSHRLTPSMVAFDERQRYIGEFAQTQQLQNMTQTFTQLKRLVGLPYDDHQLVSKYVPYEIKKSSRNLCSVTVNNKDLEIEQLIATLFRDHSGKKATIVVSPTWNELQRRVILDAAKIAQIDVIRLLNSTTAAAIVYSMYHQAQFKDTPGHIAIIDFGDSTLNAAIVKISNKKLDVVSFASDEHLGGSNFTDVLQDYLLEQTISKYHIDPRTSPRAMNRFRKAVETAKKAFTVNATVMFDIPSLMNDVDVRFQINRSDFEERTKDLVDRITPTIEKAIEDSKVDKASLKAVEIHGGASRVVAVKNKMREIFGQEPTQSLNPDECFAMGGGFMAAILLPQFVVSLAVNDLYAHRILLHQEETKQQIEVFPPFSPFPSKKTIYINFAKEISVYVCTDGDTLGILSIQHQLEDIVTVYVDFELDGNGIVNVTKAYRLVDVETEVDKKPAVVQQEFAVNFIYKPYNGLSAEQLATYCKEEKEMRAKDEEAKRIDESKNELESYMYALQSDLRDYSQYFDQKALDSASQSLQSYLEWFDEVTFDDEKMRELKSKDFEEKLAALKLIGEPAKKRRKSYEQITQISDDMARRLNKLEFHNEEIDKDCSQFTAWMQSKLEACEKAPKDKDPPLTRDEADMKMRVIEGKVKSALKKKAKEEKKKAEEEKKKVEEEKKKAEEEAKKETE